MGEVENRPPSIEQTIRTLARRHKKLQICFEAGRQARGFVGSVQRAGARARLSGGGADELCPTAVPAS